MEQKCEGNTCSHMLWFYEFVRGHEEQCRLTSPRDEITPTLPSFSRNGVHASALNRNNLSMRAFPTAVTLW